MSTGCLMEMLNDKQTRDEKGTNTVRSRHKRATQIAKSMAKGMAGRSPGAKPMLPRKSKDMSKAMWDEVMEIFNRIVSCGKQALAGMESGPQTGKDRDVVDTKKDKVTTKEGKDDYVPAKVPGCSTRPGS